ncbi:hypothetical protein QLX08_000599 [Tetragonisca angustula]|uniref:G-patch domain-containing protein n=1 Tax=Tetragonisca angustula TaxID=166442 RepID=A0AAW1ALB8_9HYME
MAEEGKKVSFGFAKSIKKSVLKNVIPQEEKKIDYIECLDEKSIKLIGGEERKDEPLVIPLLGSRTWHDRIVNKVDADIFVSKTTKEKIKDIEIDDEGEKSKLSNGKSPPKTSIKKEVVEDNENKVVTLEEQAAKEIIQELKSKDEQETKTNDLSLPLVEDESLKGKEQSTLEDYERIPIDAFGVAMLRGMGWQPGKGIGKNEKVVSAVIPELRPKGMGLGADKVTLQKKSADSKKQEEELKIEKGTYVKIIAGKQSNNYGQIEGFDDDAGRLIIKLALGGNTISVNEFMVQPVTKSEYSKNSKVLNARKYEEYKDKESKEFKHKTDKKESISDDSEDIEDDNKSNDEKKNSNVCDKDKYDKTNRKPKKQKKYPESEGDSDNGREKKRRKRRSSSNSDDSYKSKKSKKSKKHKKHDYSPERLSKKHKKKDKEKEKIKDKKSRDYTDRRKRKKRGRSRSRSSSRL